MAIHDLNENRATRRIDQAAAEIDRQAQAATVDTGLYTIVAPDPDGGWIVQDGQGGLIYNVMSETTRGLGRGVQVSISQGARGARLDARPIGSSQFADGAGSGSTANTPTNSSSGTLTAPLYLGGTGSLTKYRPNPNSPGECLAVSYQGNVKSGDFATEAECVNDQDTGDKSWYCEVENGSAVCRRTTPGLGKWGSREQCEENIVKPLFSGGQCPVLYNVAGTYTAIVEPTYQNVPACGGTSGANGTFSGTTIGPISQIEWTGNSHFIQGGFATFNGGTDPRIEGHTDITVGCSGPGVSEITVTSVSVSRADGQPDNCGSAPEQCGL